MATKYIASGSVRGDCDHTHRSIEAAAECAAADNRAVKRGHGQNAYSDRVVYAVTDGHRTRAYVDED